ncbi:adenosine deaminase [Macrosteles quadrilineatus]|uniref:adenosine deaminase n=1 Tax=Macrosteles quadrilineatus TaxID=74068 RepID=UPI0023E28025|nr:adenosine deaminase [Macrosteles quadrilineatus]
MLKLSTSKLQYTDRSLRGDLDALERVAYEFCEDEYYAGVIYAEVRYSPRLALGNKALLQLGPSALDEVIVRISHGLERGLKDFGVKTKQILCARYSEEFNDLVEVLHLCQKHYDKGVVGIDLLTLQPSEGVVDEAPCVEPIISVYREAAQTGVHRTIHAAEVGTATAVDRAVYKLGSERVGHGYHVVEDPNIYQRCIKDQVHFECCPYSSLMTGSVNAWGETHPICRFARDGASFSVNADDPTVTGYTVLQDYELLSSWGLSLPQLTMTSIHACNSSFLSDNEKKELLHELKTFNLATPVKEHNSGMFCLLQ